MKIFIIGFVKYRVLLNITSNFWFQALGLYFFKVFSGGICIIIFSGCTGAASINVVCSLEQLL